MGDHASKGCLEHGGKTSQPKSKDKDVAFCVSDIKSVTVVFMIDGAVLIGLHADRNVKMIRKPTVGILCMFSSLKFMIQRHWHCRGHAAEAAVVVK